MRTKSHRLSRRENTAMKGVSQEGLIRFANTFRQPAAPGFEIVETPRYRIVLQPDPRPTAPPETWSSARLTPAVRIEPHPSAPRKLAVRNRPSALRQRLDP